MKIPPVEAELFHADGQTDVHEKANIRFSQFCERAQKKLKKRGLDSIDSLATTQWTGESRFESR